MIVQHGILKWSRDITMLILICTYNLWWCSMRATRVAKGSVGSCCHLYFCINAFGIVDSWWVSLSILQPMQNYVLYDGIFSRGCHSKM